MPMRAAGLHIVLVEDNPSELYLMKLALEESGLEFEITSFQTGADALSALCPAGSGGPALPPDVILLDLNTPRGDGFEVLAGIRQNVRLSHVPVAIVTSSASPADKRRTELLGATTYIQKPTQLDAFLDSIGSAVREMLASARL
jgi:CheY-like chemotaxis protein